MEQVLIYSDSLTWGIIPNTRERLPFDRRWPGIFENTLLTAGKKIRIVENCLNGRRTAWPDPFKPGRNGAEGLSQVIEMHSPLKLVVLMLGTNDFQCTHDNSAWLSSQGMSKLINIIRQSPIEPGMPVPEILIVAPPSITQPKGPIAEKFRDAEKRFRGLGDELAKVATESSTHFFNAGKVTQSSKVDGIHLDEPDHKILGKALAEFVLENRLV
ncbi:MAG: SGNH/GDSL hydrolase family protein [Candidatus Thiodiazotropha sp.]